MTDAAASSAVLVARAKRLATRMRGERQTAIVPAGNVAGRALTTVIAIMTFLAALTVGTVSLVSDTASRWQNDISDEVTVQVKPAEGIDMPTALETARQIALQTPGVTGASILDQAATSRLLEPWLGDNIDFDALPVPRLVIVSIDTNDPPNFAFMREELKEAVPEAELDDHRAWVSRLVTMARTVVLIGVFVLSLVIVATTMTVVFATRGAMSGNRHIVEVLHFVGAQSGFIAREFERHFLRLGLMGAVAGGSVAIVLFVLIGYFTEVNRQTPQADQISALFGSFTIGWTGYAGVIILIATVATLTALTSRLTVTRHLAEIDMISPVEN
ncbi:cell division protein FtsX [Jiella mangrovi]|uniref:ABC transporter permease n=1 Tax=Jiella mangrovi TaxID=2821407 RepID=A0ABS4BGH5_9HYPH|nr:ABC transporter permease [Jiella mangrovi]MBP0615154.1 ABC transporter permease [Jiella mangrovi]